jgi:hypothetical protein
MRSLLASSISRKFYHLLLVASFEKTPSNGAEYASRKIFSETHELIGWVVHVENNSTAFGVLSPPVLIVLMVSIYFEL